jgi:hypothetical protein
MEHRLVLGDVHAARVEPGYHLAEVALSKAFGRITVWGRLLKGRSRLALKLVTSRSQVLTSITILSQKLGRCC